VELLNGQTYQLPVVSGQTTKFYLDTTKLPFVPSHTVFQVHSQWYQVTVSFDDDNCDYLTSGRYAVGTSVGLVSLSADSDPLVWCLTPVTMDSDTFKVMVIALVYKTAGW